jgi:hypothetical protein
MLRQPCDTVPEGGEFIGKLPDHILAGATMRNNTEEIMSEGILCQWRFHLGGEQEGPPGKERLCLSFVGAKSRLNGGARSTQIMSCSAPAVSGDNQNSIQLAKRREKGQAPEDFRPFGH